MFFSIVRSKLNDQNRLIIKSICFKNTDCLKRVLHINSSHSFNITANGASDEIFLLSPFFIKKCKSYIQSHMMMHKLISANLRSSIKGIDAKDILRLLVWDARDTRTFHPFVTPNNFYAVSPICDFQYQALVYMYSVHSAKTLELNLSTVESRNFLKTEFS